MDDNQNNNYSSKGFYTENDNRERSNFNYSVGGFETNYQEAPVRKKQDKLPDSGKILSLGILSIVSLCCCGPVLGPIFAIIALVMSSKTTKIYKMEPEKFTTGSVNNFKAGKICAIVGLCLGGVYLLISIASFMLNFAFNQEFMQKMGEFWNAMNY